MIATETEKKLRSHQATAIAEARELIRQGARAILIERPTGSGKTVLAAEVFRLAGSRPCLFIAPRRILVNQAAASIASWLEEAEPVAVEMGAEHGLSEGEGARIGVASIQSLARRVAEGSIDLARWARGLVIVDEVHGTALAPSYRPVIEGLRDAGARLIGLSATPTRSDDGLETVFDASVEPVTVADAIRAGWLVPPRLFLCRLDADLGNVRRSHGDFSEADLGRELSQEEALASVARPIVDTIGDRHGLVFAAGVEHAESLARTLNAMSGNPDLARSISYKTPERKREELIADLAARRVRLLVNPSLLSEGFDVPAIDFVANARPTSSRSRHVQAIGRGLRSSPGKTECLVVEFHAANLRHKLAGAWDLATEDAPDDLGEIMAMIAERESAEGNALGLDDLRQRAEIERAALRLEILYRLARVDPLAAIGIDPESVEVQGELTPRPTEKQRAVLDRAGIKPEAIDGMSRRSASRVIESIMVRSRQGLATPKQCKALARSGFEGVAATFEQAGAALDLIGGAGWRVTPELREKVLALGVPSREPFKAG